MVKQRANKKRGISVKIWHGGMLKGSPIVKYVGGQATCIYHVCSMDMNWVEETVKSLGYNNYISLAYYPPRKRVAFEEVSLEFVESNYDIEKMFAAEVDFGFLKIYIEAVNLDEQTLKINEDMSKDKGKKKLIDDGRESETDSEIRQWFEHEVQVESVDDEYINDSDVDDDEYKEAKFFLKEFRESNVHKVADMRMDNEPNSSGFKSCAREEMVDGNNSDYQLSDEEPQTPETSDPDDIDISPNKKPRTKIYNPKCNHKEMKWEPGLRFTTPDQFRIAVQNYAVEGGYGLKWKRTGVAKMEVVCRDKCTWNVYASKVSGQRTFMVKTVNDVHICSRATKKNTMANRQWLANEYMKEYRKNSNFSVADLQKHMMENFALKVTQITCYRARSLALNNIRGSLEQHYVRLRSYVGELKRSDREGTFELEVNTIGEKAEFNRIYICFRGLRKGFIAGCRQVISLDGAFLKTLLGGCILSAIGRDGNNQMFPIAWAVCVAENEVNWKWFLGKLCTDLGIDDGFGWTFINDQQKGLLNALTELVPNSEVRNCARHIYANWKKKFNGAELKEIFWRIVYTTNVPKHRHLFEELKAIDEAAAQDFKEKRVHKFCKAFFSTLSKCDNVDNNMAETFNGWICKARLLPIIDMLEQIRTDLMERMNIKYNLMIDRDEQICPRIAAKLEKLKWDARMCVVRPTRNEKFQVKIFEEQYVVDLPEKTCSCGAWKLSGIPCVHGISSIMFMRQKIDGYVDECYKKPTYLEAYKWPLEPLNGPNMWPQTEGYPVCPPPFRTMPGRPKTKRKRSTDEKENHKSKNALSRKGTRISCKKCNEYDHNSRTCKARASPSQNPSETRATTRLRPTGDKRVIAKERVVASKGCTPKKRFRATPIAIPNSANSEISSKPLFSSQGSTSGQSKKTTSNTLNTNVIIQEGQHVLPKPNQKFKKV